MATSRKRTRTGKALAAPKSLRDAIDATDSDVPATEREAAKAWRRKIEDARKFDENARTAIALSRSYARNESGSYEVPVPVAPTNIQILKSFLYARNPDLDIEPSPSTNPPAQADLIDIAKREMAADPNIQMQIAQAGEQAVQQAMGKALIASAVGGMLGGGGPPAGPPGAPPPGPPGAPPMGMPDPNAIRQQAIQQATMQIAKQRATQLMAPFRQRLSQAKQFAETLEIVVNTLWKRGRLKQAMKPVVGSTLTIGLGWLKATWQERDGYDAQTLRAINDTQALLDRIEEEQSDLDDPDEDPDEVRGELEQKLIGLQAQKVTLAQGFAIDYVDAEDIQVSPDVLSLEFYLDAPWIAHRVCMSKEDAEVKFPKVAGKLDKATAYFRRKPKDPKKSREDTSVDPKRDVQPGDADSRWTTNQGWGTSQASYGSRAKTGTQSGENGIAAWEVWCREDNMVYTVIEGIDAWACEPWPPDPETTRFYPFFMASVIDVNGERHPDSLIRRTQDILDDINKLYSNRAEHRRRSIPKVGVDATRYDKTQLERLMAGGIGEFVPLVPTKPGENIATAFAPIVYAKVDEALYDDKQQRAEIERAWGIQEALASTIQTPKTATEAQIQETGTNARADFMRDGIDSPLEELALYTSEVAVQKVSIDDAREMAGPWALWPQLDASELSQLVEVQIKAGSTGKPDTVGQRQTWAMLLPVLQQSVVQIGQLRGSTPDDIADCLEELVAETLRRSGESIDPDRFLPRSPATAMMPPPPLPAPPVPTAPPVTLAPLAPIPAPPPSPAAGAPTV